MRKNGEIQNEKQWMVRLFIHGVTTSWYRKNLRGQNNKDDGELNFRHIKYKALETFLRAAYGLFESDGLGL